MQYRKEIDGLRALAVLPVILFHAGGFGFSGGYIGVDIFFVISGFLITRIIVDELTENNFSIKRFYERRAKRILPALSFVLIITTILAFIFMPANLLKSYANSLISVVTFTSNFHFFTTSGYFSTLADQKPLLHTWSLAVEEQFYLFFPLLLSYFWLKGIKLLIKIIFGLAASSLLLSHFLALNLYTDANFYLIFSRAWELFAGALIALTNIDKTITKKWLRESLGIIGLALIFYAIFIFDDNTLFPSFWTVIPVMGSMLIIAFSNENTLIGRLLSNRFMVSIGLISYSLYLWHQPLFAFLRLKSIGEPTTALFLVAITLTFLLATISYRYIEQPFRKKTFLIPNKRFTTLQYASISIILFIIIGLIGVAKRGFPTRFNNDTYLSSVKYSPKRKVCHFDDADYKKPEKACHYFGKKVTWAVLGDSHVVEPAYALAKALKKKNQGVLHLSFSQCLPAIHLKSIDPDCSTWFNDSLTYLEKNKTIKNVYLGFRYTSFLFGEHQAHYPKIPNENPKQYLAVDFQHMSPAKIRDLYWQSLHETVSRLIASGKTVYLQYPIAELPVHISNLLTPFSIFGGKLRFDLEKTTTADYYFSRHNYILNKLNLLPYNNKLKAVKPFDLLCSANYCPAVNQGKSLYFDNNHLSIVGAKTLINNSNIAN